MNTNKRKVVNVCCRQRQLAQEVFSLMILPLETQLVMDYLVTVHLLSTHTLINSQLLTIFTASQPQVSFFIFTV